MVTVQCHRCYKALELLEKPTTTGVLCNECWMRWKDIESKLLGHVYADEMRKKFEDFVQNDKPWK